MLAVQLGARRRVRGYFDSIDWELLLKAVRKHTECPWVLLYIERWLKAPVQMQDGSIVPRTAGTPQGGVISPLLANLFLHYAFDTWMARKFPDIPFERYADDVICHCRSEEEARALWSALEVRFGTCGLVLHPQKTRLVYCKDADRPGDYPVQAFDFLGYEFRPRTAVWRDVEIGSASRSVRRGGRQGAQSDQADGPTMGASRAQRQVAGRSRADVQSSHPSLGLNYYSHFYGSALCRDPAADRRLPGPMGP